MANKIQVKRGVNASLPTLAAGEFGFSADTYQIHIGDGAVNHEVLMHDLLTAQSVIAATTSGTPTALTVDEQTLVGRLTSGNVAAISIGIANDNIVQIDDAAAADNDFAKFTTAGLEGRSYSEVMGDLSGTAAADFAMNTHKITGVVDPTANQDAATKAYVDSLASGLDVKASCDVATAAALPACTAAGAGVGKTLTATVSGTLPVDGVDTVLNDRILVKNQAAGEDNGIYKVTTAGTASVAFILTRATDFDTNAEVSAGAFTFIAEGTASADQGWVLSTNDPITLDTTVLAFSQFSGAGTITAGAGLTKTGDTIDVGAGTGVTVNANDIAVNYGTTATTACVGNDARLSDARTPTGHNTTHVTGGSDIIANAVAAGNAGLMTGADKTKLDGVATSANNYSHPTGDGNLHVIATSTTNDGKVLTAGATAGSLSWAAPTVGTVTTVSGTAPVVSSGGSTPAISMAASTASVDGYATSVQITKLDGIETGAEVNNISDVDATDLTDAGASTLHYHASDRDLANATGVMDGGAYV